MTRTKRTVACEGCGAKYAPSIAGNRCPVCGRRESKSELEARLETSMMVDLLNEIDNGMSFEYRPESRGVVINRTGTTEETDT